ncbi:FAD-dependent oxidoreductase [Streptomyces guryensis]|uniref:FAD-dependent monooxygenase n=1 Tax=Streptomyces guryensis TaxID=2886947 RepID=A0A9Q3VQ62_9ACTN|nr:FAD-dependent monooxygenase [Streptomyces guryensis]MCD9875659.1 FAD-dependent monooxygenase [Streptomyces guryensis]
MTAGSTPTPARPPRRALVIGGGLTGMLAAQALSTVAEVVVIERDMLPERPEPRTGLPQGHHTHLLWSGGAEAIESLLAGTARQLEMAGARRIPLTTGMVAYSAQGWFRRWPESHYVITCSRDLLDWVIRSQVLKNEHIEVKEGADVTGLTGSAAAVTGVTIRTDDGEESTLHADLVIDASGRGSRAPHWLDALGAPPVATREVDSGLVYASRVYQAPAGLPDTWPIINVQADPRADGPGQAGVIMPIEHGRWLVTLSGTRGGQPTDDLEDFQRFALGLRHPIVGELLGKAAPLGPVRVTRMTANRRRYYERTPMPAGFVVLGDALASYNPTYGHGMSVAAQSAVALRETIRLKRGWGAPDLAACMQRAAARRVNTAWTFATGADVFYDGATETGPSRSERVAARFVDRLTYTATGTGRVARALTDVMTLQTGPATLARSSILIATLRGPLKSELTQPPLTVEERQAVDYA